MSKDVMPPFEGEDLIIFPRHEADDRRITGCPLSQNTRDRITRIAAECGVDLELREVAIETRPAAAASGRTPSAAKLLTICAVPEVRGRIVTAPDGRLLRRVGGDSRPLRGDALAHFVRERELRSGEDELSRGISAAAFDVAAIDAALTADGRAPVSAADHAKAGSVVRTGAAPSTRAKVLRALSDLGVAQDALPPTDTPCAPRRGGAVRRRPAAGDARSGGAASASHRHGTGSRPRRAAPLAETVRCCLEFVADHTASVEVVAGVRREKLPEYPVAVLREAVVNALAHRDYNLIGATVDITVWDDRVEVRSPGPLPGHITKENMRDEHYSRNPRIMRVLKSLGLVEEYGEGVDRMYREMEARLLAPPTFDATASSVTVTLHNRSLVDAEDQAWLLGLAETTHGGRTPGGGGGKTRPAGSTVRRLERQSAPDCRAMALGMRGNERPPTDLNSPARYDPTP